MSKANKNGLRVIGVSVGAALIILGSFYIHIGLGAITLGLLCLFAVGISFD